MTLGAHRPRRPTAAQAVLAALGVAQIAYGRSRRPRPPTATRWMLGLLLATSATEALEARGARQAAASVAAPGAIGLAAEFIGVATGWPFGRYSYSNKLGRRIGGVPVLAAAAWAIMARPAWVAAGWLSSRPSRRVPLAAGALTAWDVYLDPRMVSEGYWSWRRAGRYEGIPASNFAGWFVTGLFAFAVFAMFDSAGPEARDDGALRLYVWTWIGEGFANGVLWRRRVPAAAGLTSMGATALPALTRRLRG